MYSIGNKKIGKDTVIINIHTATTCPAKDMCLLRGRCYALANERIRPTVLPFRLRQEQFWKENPASVYVDYLRKLKNGFLNYIRFHEAGDFACQADVDKMSEIADGVEGMYRCYAYTARYDLDYSNKSKNLVLDGTYFMIDNMYVPLKKDELAMGRGKGTVTCPNDCRICDLCKEPRGLVIYNFIKGH